MFFNNGIKSQMCIPKRVLIRLSSWRRLADNTSVNVELVFSFTDASAVFESQRCGYKAKADFTFVSTDFYFAEYLSFLPASEAESPVLSHSAEFNNLTGTLQRLTSDLDTYVDESEENQDVSNTLDLLYYRT